MHAWYLCFSINRCNKGRARISDLFLKIIRFRVPALPTHQTFFFSPPRHQDLPAIGFALSEASGSLCLGGKHFLVLSEPEAGPSAILRLAGGRFVRVRVHGIFVGVQNLR